MKAKLYFENVWLDSDVIELKIVADDGNSIFKNHVYVAYPDIEELIEGLDIFKKQVYGGLYDMKLGEFGSEFANGAFNGRLHFYEKGKIYITIKMQSEFYDFGSKNVASEAILYLKSEPVLLDKFIYHFKTISKEIGNEAVLECI